jgi:hypothetical protein
LEADGDVADSASEEKKERGDGVVVALDRHVFYHDASPGPGSIERLVAN